MTSNVNNRAAVLLALLAAGCVTQAPSGGPPAPAAPWDDRITEINARWNEVPYVTDLDNYGVADYWATPAELLARGGDCEDYALAKAADVAALGVPAWVVVVWDGYGGVMHAVTLVHATGGPYVLDNRFDEVLTLAESTPRFRAVYAALPSGAQVLGWGL